MDLSCVCLECVVNSHPHTLTTLLAHDWRSHFERYSGTLRGLYYASKTGHGAVVQVLLEAGADQGSSVSLSHPPQDGINAAVFLSGPAVRL